MGAAYFRKLEMRGGVVEKHPLGSITLIVQSSGAVSFTPDVVTSRLFFADIRLVNRDVRFTPQKRTLVVSSTCPANRDIPCVYRKPKSERNGDAVRRGSRVS